MQLSFLTVHRALIGLCCLLIATVGVAYAAFASNDVHIPSNTITTASANLELSDDGQHFSRQLSGYEFSNLIPGAAPSGNRVVFLHNSGSTRLHLNLLLARPFAAQTASHINMNAVYIVLTSAGTSESLAYSFESFHDGQPKLFGATLEPGQTMGLTLQAQIADGALSDTTEQVILEDFSMVFGGKPEVV